jgi:hypothetical protein
LLIAAFTLMAFAFQSYVTQTHIHIAQPQSAASTATDRGDSNRTHKAYASQRTVPGDQAPSNDDPVKCPLCQAVGYAGHFVTPSAAATLLLPLSAISILPLTTAAVPPRESPSHIWQGRGPPNS